MKKQSTKNSKERSIKVWRMKKMLVRAHTKGEARALFKKKLGIDKRDRLAEGAEVVYVATELLKPKSSKSSTKSPAKVVLS